MFQVKNLQCERGGRELFADLDFQLEAGQALQIVGKNGAGKSSLIRILAGLLRADAGNIFWKGEAFLTKPFSNEDSYPKDLLYIGHKAGVNLQLTAEQNLSWYSQLYANAESNIALLMEQAFKEWQLYGFEDLPCYMLSAGQQRRVALCRLILEKKSLWLLDEPLVSIDNSGIEILNTLAKLHLKQGGCLIFSSHQALELDGQVKVLNLDDYSHILSRNTEFHLGESLGAEKC